MDVKFSKKSLIEYMADYKMDEEVKLPIWEQEIIGRNSIKMYEDALLVTHKLDSCSRMLLDWLLFNKTYGGEIDGNAYYRAKFIRYCQKLGKEYKDGTVKMAYNSLVHAEILLKLNRGVYVLNARYFYSGTDADRAKQVKAQLTVRADKHEKEDLIKNV